MTIRTLSPSRSTEPKALKHGLRLTELGYWIVAIHPKTKRPIGSAWGLTRWDQKRLRSAFERYSDAGIGICLGPGRAPGSGCLIDIEGDGERARESLAKLLGGEIPDTPAWSSTRGEHTLFIADIDRLQQALAAAGAVEGKDEKGKGAWHLPEFPGLEFRIGGFKADGTVKQVQSVVPPTPGTDGKPRAWVRDPKGGGCSSPRIRLCRTGRPGTSEAVTRCHPSRALWPIETSVDGISGLRRPQTFPSSRIFGKVADVMPRQMLGFTSSADRPGAWFSGMSPDGTGGQLRYPRAFFGRFTAGRGAPSSAAPCSAHRGRGRPDRPGFTDRTVRSVGPAGDRAAPGGYTGAIGVRSTTPSRHPGARPSLFYTSRRGFWQDRGAWARL
jgi:hypothetical protein